MSLATAHRLSPEQKRHLRERGYVHVAGAVGPDLVGRALRAINSSLGRGLDQSQVATFQSQTFCPELKSTTMITDLFERSAAKSIAESAIGPVKPVTGGQCALRWPLPLDAGQPSLGLPHIDGTYAPNNGVPRGKIHDFTALACVFLSDVPHENAGNFTIWPGSHLTHARYFREHGYQALLQAPQLDLGAPLQLTGRAGDMVLTHYLLGHTGGINVSPHVRYAVFFRVVSVDAREAESHQWIGEPWRYWAGMNDAE